MQIQVNTDRNIAGHAALAARLEVTVQAALERFSSNITRVEVHLSDENSSHKGGNDDIRCMVEVRLEGHNPIAVTHKAATPDQALDGATDKLERLIDSTLERRRDQRNRSPGSAEVADDAAPEA